MQRISVYDEDAEEIEKICEDKDIPEAELIAALIAIVNSDEIELDDWV